MLWEANGKIHNDTFDDFDVVDCFVMGHVFEIRRMGRKNNSCRCFKLDKDNMLVLSTGEIVAVQHADNRAQNPKEVANTIAKLRRIINANVTEPSHWKWITLTYAENMTDENRLYKDFEKFIKKVRYKFDNYDISYITVPEPQGRGAWHMHLLLGFNDVAPFISNSVIAKLWGHGFTKTNKLNDIDNIRSIFLGLFGKYGAYRGK